eukprot:816514_1
MWREEWSQRKCELRGHRGNAMTNEYSQMYLKYWESVAFYQKKTRKRKREEHCDECPPNKRPRRDTDHAAMGFDENVFSAIAAQKTDLDRAIAASMKSATDDEHKRRKRKRCIRDSDSEEYSDAHDLP